MEVAVADPRCIRAEHREFVLNLLLGDDERQRFLDDGIAQCKARQRRAADYVHTVAAASVEECGGVGMQVGEAMSAVIHPG